MSTTLVNVGILNGRSTKLDTEDLTVLSDIVENYSTDLMVSTPEIIIPELNVQETTQVASSESDQVEVDRETTDQLDIEQLNVEPLSAEQLDVDQLTIDLTEQKHSIDEACLIDSLRIDNQVTDFAPSDIYSSLLSKPDEEVASTTTEEHQPGTSQEDLTSELTDTITKSEIVETEVPSTGTEETRTTEDEHVTSVKSSETGSDQTAGEHGGIELAKQAAIEAALMAAANQSAIAQSPLIQPTHADSTESDPEEFPLEGIAEQNSAGESLTETSDDRETTESDSGLNHSLNISEITPEESAQHLDGASMERAVERLQRENHTVDEITSGLLDRMEANPLTLEFTEPDTEKSVAILAPTEKQYDRLVDNVLEKTVPGMPTSIMIAGCEKTARTGKVASNIATLLAGKNLGKILLIDGDMLEKTLTDSLINSHEQGLIEVLNREESLESTILPTGMANLYFLPAGIAKLSREKTMAGRMAALNQQLRQTYRFIVVDGGNSNVSVCRTFSSFCDATYLAISLGQTYCATAAGAVEDLQAAGSRLLGTIVTK